VCNWKFYFFAIWEDWIGTFHFGKAKVIWEPLLIKRTKLKHTQLIEGICVVCPKNEEIRTSEKKRNELAVRNQIQIGHRFSFHKEGNEKSRPSLSLFNPCKNPPLTFSLWKRASSYRFFSGSACLSEDLGLRFL